MRKAFLFLILFQPFSALGFFTEVNGLYVSDSLSATSESSISRLYADFAFGMDLTNKGQWLVGWSVLSISSTDSDDDEVSFSTLDTGPKLSYFIDRNKVWSVSFTYNLKATASYTATNTEVTWRGTSMKFEFAYAPRLSESWYAGLKVNYYATTLTEQFDSSNSFSEIANSRTVLWPSIFARYQID